MLRTRRNSWNVVASDTIHRKNDQLDRQKPSHSTRSCFRAVDIGDWRVDAAAALQIECTAGAGVAAAVSSFACQHGLNAAPSHRKLKSPLLEKSLPRQIADRFTAQTCSAGREGFRQRQIGVFGLLCEFVMRQVIGAIRE